MFISTSQVKIYVCIDKTSLVLKLLLSARNLHEGSSLVYKIEFYYEHLEFDNNVEYCYGADLNPSCMFGLTG